MNEHLDERLSLLLDGELSPGEVGAAEAHLVDCAACQALLEDLKRIRREARALGDLPPAHDLWAGIASRLADEPAPGVVAITSRRRRLSFSVPQLAAAAIGLVALSAGTATLLLRRQPPPAVAPSAQFAMLPGYVDSTMTITVSGPVDKGVVTYDQAIRDIELTLAQRRTRLDTATVRAVEQSLRIIDAAILQARAALARDTNNLYLNTHLQNALDRKLDLLRQVATLPSVS